MGEFKGVQATRRPTKKECFTQKAHADSSSMPQMTENAVVFYTKGCGNIVSKSINFGSPYAPGESKQKYGIDHDGTVIGAAQAYYDTLEIGEWVAAKRLVTFKRNYDVANQEYVGDGEFATIASEGDASALEELPDSCATEYYQ